jgi:replication factor C subunit 2/4
MLFIEKYKPKKFEDIIGNNEIINQLKKMYEKRLIPNLIITGSSGLGKTSSIHCLCHNYLTNIKENLLEINTSIDKNFSFIRSILLDFIKRKSNEQKIVVLEEIDNLPETSQYSIYSLLNEYNIIYILTCNSINKVTKNLKSKCLVLNFKTLTNKEIETGLMRVIRKEYIEYGQKGLNLLIKYSNNDLRYAINNLQALHIGYKKITYSTIHTFMEYSLEYILNNFLKTCLKRNFKDACIIIDKLIKDKYMFSDIIFILGEQLNKFIFVHAENQIKYINIISEYHLNILKGVKTPIQLYALTYELCNF